MISSSINKEEIYILSINCGFSDTQLWFQQAGQYNSCRMFPELGTILQFLPLLKVMNSYTAFDSKNIWHLWVMSANVYTVASNDSDGLSPLILKNNCKNQRVDVIHIYAKKKGLISSSHSLPYVRSNRHIYSTLNYHFLGCKYY